LKTGRVVEDSIEDRTGLTLSHTGKVLEAGCCKFDDVVKCACHLSDVRDFDRFNAVYAQFFPGVKPARTSVQSVPWGRVKVEIDAVARVPESNGGRGSR
jgi:2-iminobutanoate/2-iminopropanoate deaminase